uniref:Heterogeneous nuclear ribonucleoprotein Q n=1 Tax=Anthurium amnicola TaxID=1678845 RepID=A0A1D1XCN7_9ARAE
MRTPKSGGTKKTPQPKNDASVADATSAEQIPEMVAAAATKATPKSGTGTKAAKNTGKQSTPITAAASYAPPEAAATLDEDEQEKFAIPQKRVEEHKSVTSIDEGKPEKPDSPENEEMADLIQKGETMVVTEEKSRVQESPTRKENESAEKHVALEGADYTMEEYGEQQDFDETGDGDLPRVEGEDADGVGEEEARLKEDEQIEMSDMIKERKKKKELEIFVGGLDRDATEEDVKKVFGKIGDVEEVRLHKDFTTNKNKGFAFVKFADKVQVSRALSELKNPVIRGKRCGIAPSEDNDTLFLGNICNTWTKEAIKRRLKEYGVEGLENITLVEDTQNEGLSRGFAFLEFSYHEFAMNAYKRLQKPDVVFGHSEWTAKVAFAEPLREPDAEVMAQVKSVFVDGMPPYWDEDRVKEHFKGFGEMERVVLARNMPTAKRRDFGFVNFTTHEAAVACVEAVNNTELGDGKSKMKARARLANPLPKMQAVKGGIRGGFRIGHSGIGFFSRFGRGFGRGRLPFGRAGLPGARGFHLRGRGRSGRFSFPPDNSIGSSHIGFRGRRPFGVQGGLRGRSRRGAFDGGRGRPFQPRRESFGFESDFGSPFDGGHFAEDPYYYGDIGYGVKRSFSMMEHDASYLEPGNRLRPRYDLADQQWSSGARYRDPMRSAGDLYSRDYYGSDYGSSGYSSVYEGEHSGGGYYY